MFSSKLPRAAHRAVASSTPSSACATATISTSTSRCTARPSPHQRRHSSSKASSWPPDNSTGKPTPATKSGAAGEAVSTAKSSPKQAKARGKAGYKRVAEVKKDAEPVDQFAGLPSVPAISGMRVEDLTLSKFFSLHRPVSITTTIPPPSTPEAFSSLFTSQQIQDPWANGNSAERRPEDVIYTLHNTIESLENSTRNAEDEGVRWEVIHESPTNVEGGVKHLDAVPRMKSVEELVAQFRPFKAPPAPEPFPDEIEQQTAPEKKASSLRSSTRGRPRKKTYTATITVTESTDATGQKTYSASSSPIVRLPDAEDLISSPRAVRDPAKARFPFRTRMQQRHRSNAATRVNNMQATSQKMPTIRRAPSAARQGRMHKMFLISVKRQRKLKMKKHKYKKLMKRTRTLRRKLDKS